MQQSHVQAAEAAGCHRPQPPGSPLTQPTNRPPTPFLRPLPQIDMATGQKVDTMLDGCVVCSPGQQQRTYQVRADPDFIW